MTSVLFDLLEPVNEFFAGGVYFLELPGFVVVNFPIVFKGSHPTGILKGLYNGDHAFYLGFQVVVHTVAPFMSLIEAIAFSFRSIVVAYTQFAL